MEREFRAQGKGVNTYVMKVSGFGSRSSGLVGFED